MQINTVNKIKSPYNNIGFSQNYKNKAYCDTVSFGHNYHKGDVRKSDNELLESIKERLYGKDAQIIHNNIDSENLNRFYIKIKYNTLATGVIHYDDKNELQYITMQKCRDGSMNSYDDLSVFDKLGNEVKHLSHNQVKVLRGYRGNTGYNINCVLRYYDEDNPFLRDEINVMDSLFKDAKIYSVTKEPTTVYRGLKLNKDYIENEFVAGKIYNDKAFLSTSDRPESAVPNERNVLLKIEVPKGKKYIDMHLLTSPSDFYINEHEMLFDRNSKFMVKNFDSKAGIVSMKLL